MKTKKSILIILILLISLFGLFFIFKTDREIKNTTVKNVGQEPSTITTLSLQDLPPEVFQKIFTIITFKSAR